MLEIVPITLFRTKCSFCLFRSGYKPGSFRECGDIKGTAGSFRSTIGIEAKLSWYIF